MQTIRSLSFSLGCAAVAGCATLNPTPHVRQAEALVEERIGTRPDWTQPCDEVPPAWDGATVLSMDEAVAQALRNNRELRGEIEMIGQANADLVQAGLLQNPVINVMAMLPEGGGRAMLRGNALPMQPLQDLWLIPARKQVAVAQLQQTILRVADRALQTAADVRTVFVNLQWATRSAELIEDNVRIVDQSTHLIQMRQAAGKATQVEVNLSRLRRLQLQSELLSMQTKVRSLKRELLALVGWASGGEEWTLPRLNELTDALPPLPSEGELIASASDRRPDLLAAQWAVKAAEHEIELMRREGWPDFALGLTFERAPAARSQNQTWAGKFGNSAFRAVVNDIPPFEAPLPFAPRDRDVKYTTGPMLELEIPLFDQNQAQVAKATHEYRQSVAEFESRVQQVISKLRQSYVEGESGAKQVQFFRDEILPEVERNLRLVEQSYRSGQEEFTVYLQVREDLIAHRMKVLEFLRDVWLTHIGIERESGGSWMRPRPPMTADIPAAPEGGSK